MHEFRTTKVEDTPVRTFLIDNEPWFHLTDVCRAAGLNNASLAKRRLNSEDTDTLSSVKGIEGRGANATIINESGLYDVILDSRKPFARSPVATELQAKHCRHWVNQFRGL
ncbi:BRO-N domain-containing protein [Corynebacterium casei]|uniref:BRO-N domain-containing protein n=1 Tax=Corynebacterium casei TaxID=160386 RepID=UPI003451D864